MKFVRKYYITIIILTEYKEWIFFFFPFLPDWEEKTFF